MSSLVYNTCMKGKLTVVSGCMFSGKTTMLIRLAEKAKKEGKHIEVFYPENDTRHEKDIIKSHSDLTHESKALPLAVSEIPNLKFDTVFIDEAQFFEKSLTKAINGLVEKEVDVVVGGLDKDFRGEPFPTVESLSVIADDVVHLEAICTVCKKPAFFSQRLVESDDVILIGGKDMYQPRCQEHFIKPV